MRRETVLRSLILYLGEKEEELFEDCLVKHGFLKHHKHLTLIPCFEIVALFLFKGQVSSSETL